MNCQQQKLAEIRLKREQGLCPLCSQPSDGGKLHPQPCPRRAQPKRSPHGSRTIPTFDKFIRREEAAGRY